MSNEIKVENKKENKGSKNRIYIILLFVFLMGLGACLGVMGYTAWQEKKAQEQFESLLSSQPESESETESVADTESEMTEETETEIDILTQLGITIPEKNINWDDLYKTNEHIYAWIYIPNTNIDYPVLYHPTVDDYYLNRNLDGSVGYPGCIYAQQSYNTDDWTDFNTILYGHNMKNGTMFKTLHKFEDGKFFEENRYAYIYTPDHVYVYDIFAAYVYGNRHILYEYDQYNESRRQDYIDMVFGIRDMSAHFRDGVEITTEDKLLTLITCIGGRPNNRYLVQGVLVNPPIVDEAE